MVHSDFHSSLGERRLQMDRLTRIEGDILQVRSIIYLKALSPQFTDTLPWEAVVERSRRSQDQFPFPFSFSYSYCHCIMVGIVTLLPYNTGPVEQALFTCERNSKDRSILNPQNVRVNNSINTDNLILCVGIDRSNLAPAHVSNSVLHNPQSESKKYVESTPVFAFPN